MGKLCNAAPINTFFLMCFKPTRYLCLGGLRRLKRSAETRECLLGRVHAVLSRKLIVLHRLLLVMKDAVAAFVQLGETQLRLGDARFCCEEEVLGGLGRVALHPTTEHVARTEVKLRGRMADLSCLSEMHDGLVRTLVDAPSTQVRGTERAMRLGHALLGCLAEELDRLDLVARHVDAVLIHVTEVVVRGRVAFVGGLGPIDEGAFMVLRDVTAAVEEELPEFMATAFVARVGRQLEETHCELFVLGNVAMALEIEIPQCTLRFQVAFLGGIRPVEHGVLHRSVLGLAHQMLHAQEEFRVRRQGRGAKGAQWSRPHGLRDARELCVDAWSHCPLWPRLCGHWQRHRRLPHSSPHAGHSFENANSNPTAIERQLDVLNP